MVVLQEAEGIDIRFGFAIPLQPNVDDLRDHRHQTMGDAMWKADTLRRHKVRLSLIGGCVLVTTTSKGSLQCKAEHPYSCNAIRRKTQVRGSCRNVTIAGLAPGHRPPLIGERNGTKKFDF